VSGSLFDQYKAALRRGHVAALAGELDSALDAYREAARLVPERALPIASQGTVLHRLDRWPEAATAFDQALRMAPDDEASLRARARARDERGLRTGAADDFERLAFVLDVAGRPAEAAEAARRAADLAPSATREALADRLAAAATLAAELRPATPVRTTSSAVPTDLAAPAAPEAVVASEEPEEPPEAPAAPEFVDPAAIALQARIAELGTQPSWHDMDGRAVGGEGGAWPPVDLPSPAPPPLEGPPPDPEALLAEAAELIAAGDPAAARDRMLIAVMVHRAAGRLDAALEICLQLLTTAPGDPQVHLAIANLQLDHGWTGPAREKIDLLLRLTSLTGDTQAEADVHGLASERLRDDPVPSPATR
jgi:tetratricopeptide (TPR) repeat protein